MLTHGQWLQDVFARQDAVHAHAQTLACPACQHPGQNQIMNQGCLGEAFAWRCRMCGHRFTSGQQLERISMARTHGAVIHFLPPTLGAKTHCGRRPGGLYTTADQKKATCKACERAQVKIRK